MTLAAILNAGIRVTVTQSGVDARFNRCTGGHQQHRERASREVMEAADVEGLRGWKWGRNFGYGLNSGGEDQVAPCSPAIKLAEIRARYVAIGIIGSCVPE